MYECSELRYLLVSHLSWAEFCCTRILDVTRSSPSQMTGSATCYLPTMKIELWGSMLRSLSWSVNIHSSTWFPPITTSFIMLANIGYRWKRCQKPLRTSNSECMVRRLKCTIHPRRSGWDPFSKLDFVKHQSLDSIRHRNIALTNEKKATSIAKTSQYSQVLNGSLHWEGVDILYRWHTGRTLSEVQKL